MDALIFLFAVYGTVSTIMMMAPKKIAMKKPFNCPLCLGIWSAILLLPAVFIENANGLLYIMAGAGFAYFISLWTKGKD